MSATSALDEREESDAALLSDPNELLSKIEAFDIDIFNSSLPVQSFDKAVLFSSDIKMKITMKNANAKKLQVVRWK